MKVIQNNYKNQPRNPHKLPVQTKRVEKVKIKCENCGSVLEVLREDTHIGYIGLPYVTCPCCNYEMNIEEFDDDTIDICELYIDNGNYYISMYSWIGNNLVPYANCSFVIFYI